MDVFQVQEPLKSLDDIDLFTGAVLYASQQCGWHSFVLRWLGRVYLGL